MKVRCPHCKEIFSAPAKRGALTCPGCDKTVLLPDFLGDRKPADMNTAVLHRQAMIRRRTAGALPGAGAVFMKRPMRVFFVILLLFVIGGTLLRKARDPGELSETARIQQAERNLAILRIAAERFRNDCGRYPGTAEGLAALLINPGIEQWGGPYILGLRPDPWRRQFQYRLEDGQPIVWSMGPDGLPGTDADLFAAPPPPDEVLLDEGVYRIQP